MAMSDRGDAMAVSGEPSSDGLVMEDYEATVGPLESAALPAGLTLDLDLDGDVVRSARISSSPERLATADPLAPLAAVEAERALSHAAWLARFLDLLGWVAAAERVRSALGPLIAAQQDFLGGGDGDGWLEECAELEAALGALLGSRRVAWRAGGLAVVDAGRCRESGVRGPIARAAGIEDDARVADASYGALGFSVVTRSAGDARARAEVRIEEALGSLRLAREALRAEALPPSEGSEVEGPRGPFPVAADPARELAEETARGEELARALVAIASFDLTPGAAVR